MRVFTSVLCLALASLSGCDQLKNLIQKGDGSHNQVATNTQDNQASEEARVRGLAEFLAEMMRVVLRREPKDSVEFSSWLEAISQGASTEGIYLGFTHSSDYRKLETDGPAAKPECVTRFVREMKRIQSSMKTPTVFKAKDAEPLSEVVHPEEAGAPVAKNGVLPPLQFGKTASPSPVPAAAPTAASVDLNQVFSKAKFYTLKRVLGDETLRLLREKNESTARAEWYGPWAAELAKSGVDFGVALRNKSDAEFHKNWALSMDENRVAWEVLNRLHRILNGCL